MKQKLKNSNKIVIIIIITKQQQTTTTVKTITNIITKVIITATNLPEGERIFFRDCDCN